MAKGLGMKSYKLKNTVDGIKNLTAKAKNSLKTILIDHQNKVRNFKDLKASKSKSIKRDMGNLLLLNRVVRIFIGRKHN